ncbi:hypothetical protein Q9966_009764 [Columba livia]|nr:hypothetical protein Q9966_009764 [Columba livia]
MRNVHPPTDHGVKKKKGGGGHTINTLYMKKFISTAKPNQNTTYSETATWAVQRSQQFRFTNSMCRCYLPSTPGAAIMPPSFKALRRKKQMKRQEAGSPASKGAMGLGAPTSSSSTPTSVPPPTTTENLSSSILKRKISQGMELKAEQKEKKKPDGMKAKGKMVFKSYSRAKFPLKTFFT